MLNFLNDKSGGECRVLLTARRGTLIKYFEQNIRKLFNLKFQTC